MIKELVSAMIPPELKEMRKIVKQSRTQELKRKQIAAKNNRKIQELTCRSEPVKLEFGAGENRGISGWTYVDVNEKCDLTLDLTQPIPIPNDSVQEIYSSHLLEHFEYPQLLVFLAEALRILRPRGLFNAAVPNAEIFLDAYRTPENFDPEMFCCYQPAYYGNSRIDFVNYIAYMSGQHRYMFDSENLVIILKKAGFRNVCLRDYDSTLDIEARRSQSLYVLAEK